MRGKQARGLTAARVLVEEAGDVVHAAVDLHATAVTQRLRVSYTCVRQTCEGSARMLTVCVSAPAADQDPAVVAVLVNSWSHNKVNLV